MVKKYKILNKQPVIAPKANYLLAGDAANLLI